MIEMINSINMVLEYCSYVKKVCDAVQDVLPSGYEVCIRMDQERSWVELRRDGVDQDIGSGYLDEHLLLQLVLALQTSRYMAGGAA